MREYELVMVLRSSLTEAKRKKVLDTVKGWLKEMKVLKEDNWGLKPLAYKIKKETSGFFSVLSLEAKEAIPSDFEKKLLGVEDLLRHLLIRKK
ncbi:MAG: 30S ribosomal protein S6 [Candidatus Levybacteria bacterium]|nr:30S ribosomal protein S6 [Candidatus Levybacteria bacterium]